MNKTGLKLVFVFIVLITSNLAIAHGGRFDHFSFGFNLGYPGFYGGYGFYDPFFYPPVAVPMVPPVIVQQAPPVYIQQQEAPAAVYQQTYDWYYCQNPEGYYPYVRQCPGGWVRVDPRPPVQ